MKTSPLLDLPNIGNVLLGKLDAIDVHTKADLRRMGSIRAALRIAAHGRKDCHSMLSALEGAIRGVRWHSIPAEERKRLTDQFDRRYRRAAD